MYPPSGETNNEDYILKIYTGAFPIIADAPFNDVFLNNFFFFLYFIYAHITVHFG